MGKLVELKRTNNLLSNRINEYEDKLSKPTSTILDFSDFLTLQTSNDETSCNFYKIKKGSQSKMMTDNNFVRIVCVSGKIKIKIPYFSEEMDIAPPNTQLITPKTPYMIECLEDSEIICVSMLGKNNVDYKIEEKQTIYNKL